MRKVFNGPKPNIWLTWEYQVRNRSLSRELGLDLYEVVIKGHGATLRYMLSMYHTVLILKRTAPNVVFHQNPSILLGVLLLLLKPFWRYKIITDTHNAGLFPVEGKYRFLNWIGKQVSLRTDVLIVHNESIADVVRNWGRVPVILPDPLPSMGETSFVANPNSVVFICRWSEDEPYGQVIKAAERIYRIDPRIRVTITGNPPKSVKRDCLPKNVVLSGFLENQDYIELLKKSSILIALTTRDNSLNCAAYEALSLGKPCILSDKKVLRNFFGDNFYYTENTADGVARSVVAVFNDLNHYQKMMEQARVLYLKRYEQKIALLKDGLSSLGIFL